MKTKYFKGHYHIAFYKDDINAQSDIYYKGFDNVTEICKYKGWKVNPHNLNRIHQILHRALSDNTKHTTTLIDDMKLRVFLIDMQEEIDEFERRQDYMKQFVKINSTITVEVYPDLNAKDTTDLQAHWADRLSAKPNWVYPILIKEGIHFYPSEVKSWNSVKILEKKRLLSVSEEVDSVPEDEEKACLEMKKVIKKISARLPQAEPEVKKSNKKETAE